MCVCFPLAGGFKYFLFSPLFGDMIQFDEHIFTDGLVPPPTSLYISKGNLAVLFGGDLTSSLGFLWAVPQTTLLNYPVTGNSNLDCGTLAAALVGYPPPENGAFQICFIFTPIWGRFPF